MRQTSSDLDEACKVGFLQVVSTHPNTVWSIQPALARRDTDYTGGRVEGSRETHGHVLRMRGPSSSSSSMMMSVECHSSSNPRGTGCAKQATTM